MIEPAPNIKSEELFKKGAKLFLELQSSELFKSINNDYLYWDKVKYKSKEYSPEELWYAVKFSRLLKSFPLSFGKYHFSFTTTEYLQKSFHYFDLNTGGNLGSDVGIAETERQKYLISSIMEEAISSNHLIMLK